MIINASISKNSFLKIKRWNSLNFYNGFVKMYFFGIDSIINNIFEHFVSSYRYIPRQQITFLATPKTMYLFFSGIIFSFLHTPVLLFQIQATDLVLFQSLRTEIPIQANRELLIFFQVLRVALFYNLIMVCNGLSNQ